MRFLVVAIALLGCGPKGTSRATPKGQPLTALPIAPPVATPGERISYRLTLKNVEVGVFQLAVGDVSDLDGTPAVVVEARAKSSGLAALVATIDDSFTSWIDVKTGRPRRFEVWEHVARNSPDRDHVIVDFAARAGNAVPVHYALNDAPLKTVQQKVSMPDVWDYNAFLLACRGWEGDPGSTTTLEVFRSRYVWRMTITMGKRTTLVTELGELPVIRFDAKTTKLDRSGVPWAGQPERVFTMWISDDHDRVPLKLDADSDLGALAMDIVDYQPGSGVRLRP